MNSLFIFFLGLLSCCTAVQALPATSTSWSKPAITETATASKAAKGKTATATKSGKSSSKDSSKEKKEASTKSSKGTSSYSTNVVTVAAAHASGKSNKAKAYKLFAKSVKHYDTVTKSGKAEEGSSFSVGGKTSKAKATEANAANLAGSLSLPLPVKKSSAKAKKDSSKASKKDSSKAAKAKSSSKHYEKSSSKCHIISIFSVDYVGTDRYDMLGYLYVLV